jgi:hypothetical protein
VADEEDLEFIEILNTGTAIVDMSGIQIADFASTPYVFVNGTVLAPGARIVVGRNPGVLQAIYGTGFELATTGYGTANLSNSGETIRLLTAAGGEIQKIIYTDDPPWPTSPDGEGYTLEVVNPLGSASDPTNWNASTVIGGTPGRSPQTLLAGDFDQDSDVDGRDFLIWQRNQNIGNLSDWQQNYGSDDIVGLTSPLQAVSETEVFDDLLISGAWLTAARVSQGETRSLRGKDAVDTPLLAIDEAYAQFPARRLFKISDFGELAVRRVGDAVAENDKLESLEEFEMHSGHAT